MIHSYRTGLVRTLTSRILSLGNGEVKEVEGVSLVGVFEMEGIAKMEGLCFSGTPYIFTSWSYPSCFWTASTYPSNQGQCFAIPRQ